jgi:hypothetical protein
MNMQFIDDGIRAGAFAGVVSGTPSTLADRAPVATTRAAGTLLGAPTVPRGALAHAALSLGWGVILARLLPRRPPLVAGALAGLAIAAFDLGVVGRRCPRIRALRAGPQVADHVAYGVSVAWWLRRARR